MRKIVRIVLIAGLFLLSVSAVWAFDIIEPTEGQKIELGTVLRVVIKPQIGEKIISVGVGFDEIPYNSSMGAFVREFPIPKEAKPREIVLKIEVLLETKEILQATRTIYFTIPTSVTVQKIRVDSDQETLFMRVSKKEAIYVFGQYSDGVERNVSSSASGTTYTTSDENIAVVDTDGLVTAIGVGTAKITVRNGDKTLVIDVVVKAKKR